MEDEEVDCLKRVLNDREVVKNIEDVKKHESSPHQLKPSHPQAKKWCVRI